MMVFLIWCITLPFYLFLLTTHHIYLIHNEIILDNKTYLSYLSFLFDLMYVIIIFWYIHINCILYFQDRWDLHPDINLSSQNWHSLNQSLRMFTSLRAPIKNNLIHNLETLLFIHVITWMSRRFPIKDTKTIHAGCLPLQQPLKNLYTNKLFGTFKNCCMSGVSIFIGWCEKTVACYVLDGHK